MIEELKNSILEVLKENNTLEELPTLISELNDESRKLGLQQKAIVFSAIGLGQKTKESLEAGLKQKLNKQIYLQYKVDPQIKGGLIIRIGDKVYDYSIKRRLEEMEKNLKT